MGNSIMAGKLSYVREKRRESFRKPSTAEISRHTVAH